MSEWKEYKLGEIIQLIGGGTPKTSVPEYWDGDIPWLSVSDFNNGKKYVFTAEKHITQLGLNNSSTKLLHKDDIIISARGTVGVVAMIGGDMAFNQSCYGIRNKDLVDKQYLYYLLVNSVNGLKQNAYGGVFDTITRETFDLIDVSLPSLDEQHRIASILSSLDDKIDLLHRENATLEQMAETMFRQWFVEESKEEWKEGKLGDYVDVIDNRGKTPPYINNVTEYPIIEVNALTGNERYVNYDAVRKYVTKEVRDYWFRGHFQKNDILVSTVGSIGELAMCLEDKGVIAQNVIALHASKISPFYLYQYLLLNKDDLKGLDIGSVQPSIKVPHLLRMPIVLPPINLLNKYDSIMVEVIEKEKNNNKQIQTLIQTRDGLLPKLLSNEIKVIS